jgi:hypothetical protein
MTRIRRAKSHSPVDLILSAYLENHPDTPDPTLLRQAIAQTLAELAPGSKVLAEALAQAAHRLRGAVPPTIERRSSDAATPPDDMTDAQGVKEIGASGTDEPPRIRRRVRQTTSPQDHTLGQSELAFEFQPEQQPATAPDEPASPIPAANAPDTKAGYWSDADAPVDPESAVEPETEAVESAPRKRKRPSRPASRRRKAGLDATSADATDLDPTLAPNGNNEEPESQGELDNDAEAQPLRHTAESVFQNFPPE